MHLRGRSLFAGVRSTPLVVSALKACSTKAYPKNRLRYGILIAGMAVIPDRGEKPHRKNRIKCPKYWGVISRWCAAPPAKELGKHADGLCGVKALPYFPIAAPLRTRDAAFSRKLMRVRQLAPARSSKNGGVIRPGERHGMRLAIPKVHSSFSGRRTLTPLSWS